MKIKLNVQKCAELGVAMTAIAALIAGCGGGGSSSGSGSSGSGGAGGTLSGVVADGYLSGVTVCLDKNSNGVCDAGEPSATTDTNGAYTITGVSSGDAALYPLVAEVPASAVDKDTVSAVGQAFTLTAPAGSTFVSPLTTLAREKVLAGNSTIEADASVRADLVIPAASGVSALSNYVQLSASAVDQTNGYFRAHEAAKTLTAALLLGKSKIGSSSASTDQKTQSVLVAEAETILLTQAASNVSAPATLFDPTAVNANSIPGPDTLKAIIAANKVSVANATQDVTINFDVMNGATSIGTTGCTTPLTLGNASGVGTAGTLQDLRFYVSNVSLIDASGNYAPVSLTENSNQGRNVALLDFEDSTGTCAANASATIDPVGSTYTALIGKVAPGTYVGVAFTLGVPVLSTDEGTKVQLNHSYVAQLYPNGTIPATPLPLQNTALNWSWQSGRKFTKIEFKPASSAATLVHLGSTGCVGDPVAGYITNCASPNRVNVKFASGFNAASNKIALDIGSLFGGLDLSASKTWMSATGVAGSTAAYFFDKFQLGLNGVTTTGSSGLPINDGAAQTIFKIE
jgi:uncharacterized repeat protein (TIGR04052 family)